MPSKVGQIKHIKLLTRIFGNQTHPASNIYVYQLGFVPSILLLVAFVRLELLILKLLALALYYGIPGENRGFSSRFHSI